MFFKKKIGVYLGFLSLFFFASCSAVEERLGEEEGITLSENGEYSIHTDVEDLTSRYLKKNETIDVFEEDSGGANLLRKKVQTRFELTLIGELAAPVLDGVSLQGTDVFLSGSKAYLSYNVAGEMKKGAVDLLDLGDEEEPQVLSSMSFPGRDINAVAFKSGALFMTGSWEDEDFLSFFSKVSVSRNTFSDVITDVALPGYAGNDIHVTSSKAYITTGDNAGVFAYDMSTMTEKWTLDIPKARAVSEYESKEGPWVLTGEPAELLNIDKNGNLEETYSVGGATISESKSTLVTVKKWSLLTRGEEGFSVICSSNGQVLGNYAPPEIEREHSMTPVVNAATVSGDYVYTANGEEGVHVYEMGSGTKTSSCNSFSLNYLGHLDFGEGLSANHVVGSDEFIFVAHGLKGFSVISAEYVDDDDDD